MLGTAVALGFEADEMGASRGITLPESVEAVATDSTVAGTGAAAAEIAV